MQKELAKTENALGSSEKGEMITDCMTDIFLLMFLSLLILLSCFLTRTVYTPTSCLYTARPACLWHLICSVVLIPSSEGSSAATEDPLDAFMSCVRSQAAVDVVQRKKLHLHMTELKKEEQRLQRLIDLTRPTQLPSLQSQ